MNEHIERWEQEIDEVVTAASAKPIAGSEQDYTDFTFEGEDRRYYGQKGVSLAQCELYIWETGGPFAQ